MASIEADRAKKIKLYKNGDSNFFGKDFVLNRRKIRTFDAFLNNATADLKSNFPVRAICTPNHGHQINSLDDLEDTKQYVALGYGKFKNVGYAELENVARKDHSPTRPRQIDVRPVEHSKRYQQTSGRLKHVPTDVLTIFVYANGKGLEVARRITLTHNMMRSSMDNWEAILSLITERVNLTSGAARKLYTMNGELVTHPRQFESGASYIAVGSDVGGLKMVNYGQKKPDFHTSPKFMRKPIPMNYPRFGGLRRSRASDNSTSESNTSDRTAGGSKGPSPASHKSRSSKKAAVLRRGPQQQQEDSVFHAKAVKHQVKDKDKREVDFDQDDEDGVFKAKGSNLETSGAHEVEETRDTQVEVPIDQVEAEEVKDEIIELDDERRHRTPSPKQKTPTPRRLTPLERTPTPQQQARTPTPRERTPAPRERTPTPRQISPLPQRTPTPQTAHERTPTPRERTPTPKARTPTPRERTPTPKARTPTPNERTPSPKERTPTPRERTPSPAPERDEPTPEAQDSAQTGNDGTATPGPDDTDQQHHAAVKIQANYKGYRTRKEMQRRKEQKHAQKQNDAAITIQKNFKGFKVRKEYINRQREVESPDEPRSKAATPALHSARTKTPGAQDNQSDERTQTPAATDDQSQEPTQAAEPGQPETTTENQ